MAAPWLVNISFSRVLAWRSTDAKPSNQQDGVTGYEVDTGLYYVHWGNNWYTYPSNLVSMAILEAKLEAIRVLLAAPLAINQDDILAVLDEINYKTPAAKATTAIPIPGIGAAVAYTLGDAYGRQFEVPLPERGKLIGARFFDPDYEGIGKTIHVFSKVITQTADNSALSVSDSDQQNSIAEIEIPAANFKDLAASYVATGYLDVPISFSLPSPKCYVQAQTHGADNITAGSIQAVSLLYE